MATVIETHTAAIQRAAEVAGEAVLMEYGETVLMLLERDDQAAYLDVNEVLADPDSSGDPDLDFEEVAFVAFLSGMTGRPVEAVRAFLNSPVGF